MGKILELGEMAHQLESLRANGKKVVLCHGVFDLLHIGHIRYLRRAGELGDVLAVTVTPDRFVDKGPTRPAFAEQLRLEAVASLAGVDFAALNQWPTAEETLRLLRPDIYAKGAEYKDLQDVTGKITREAAVAEEIGCRLEFVHDITFSSSNLINRYLSDFSQVCREYLGLFRGRHSIADLTRRLDGLKDLSVLLVGDAIIDEYDYCSPLGASSKDPVLALLYRNRDVFAGGAAAVANHMARFAGKVIWCTVLGGDGQEEFFRSNLAPNVELHALVLHHAPTVRKIRFTDGYSFQKIFEVYHMEREPLPEDVEAGLQELTARFLPHVDLAVAADFGNGCIMLPLAADLSARAPFLAVNTQANAGNRGYHTIGRYPKADFIQLAGHEITLEFRNCSFSPIEMMGELKKRLQSRYILLTEGREGCSVLDDLDLARAPSFAVNVVDRVGAGDAVFSLASLLAYRQAPADVMAFLGNAAGSLAVGSIGNSKAVGREALVKYITAILK
jgi:cytidyltransferase-like protein